MTADTCTADTAKGKYLAGSSAGGSTSGNAMWTAPRAPGTYVFKCTVGALLPAACTPLGRLSLPTDLQCL
jgi:hypothetical protein